MILLVFEGKEREPKLFKAIEALGLFKQGRLIYSFCSDIQTLYKRVKKLEGGIEGTAIVWCSFFRKRGGTIPMTLFTR